MFNGAKDVTDGRLLVDTKRLRDAMLLPKWQRVLSELAVVNMKLGALRPSKLLAAATVAGMHTIVAEGDALAVWGSFPPVSPVQLHLISP